MLDPLLGVVGATVKKQTKPWQGSSDGYSVVLISKGSGVDPQSTHECINGTKKRNLCPFSLSLSSLFPVYSLKSINKNMPESKQKSLLS